MTTTKELIEFLETYARKTSHSDKYLNEAAQRLQELQAQVDSLERHILGGSVKEAT